MDLLLINPSYFFEIYLNFDLNLWIPVFILLVTISALWIHKSSGKIERYITLIHALYGSLVIGITLLNYNRVGIQDVVLNPLPTLRMMLSDEKIHAVRAMVSNILLFVPIGIFSIKREKVAHSLRAVIAGLLISCSIEIVQYTCRRGTFEVLDIICNTIGAWFGAFIWSGLKTVWRKMKWLYLLIKP